ncbi:uncharacterized protein LOC126834312 [Adelges cooleyi]|uniref:uncharacterized protein LOC126834312 n=1 Tax=Adelges cooleyi TaxID=133065 RepID=UPI0021804EE0|nr:uncharacterized protein LOC126834312 [Adelges cooleyi]
MNRMSKLIKWRHIAAAMAYCQTTSIADSDYVVKEAEVVNLKQPVENFTHKYLLQQTCSLSVNAACQMITFATVALEEASKQYKDVLYEFIDLLENNEYSAEELEKVSMESRYDIAEAKTFYLDSLSAIDSALQLGRSSLQMSFSVEANAVFNIMSDRLYTAEQELKSIMQEIRKVEDLSSETLSNVLKKLNKDK